MNYYHAIITSCLLAILANMHFNVNTTYLQNIIIDPKLASSKTEKVSFCKIMKNPENYDGKIVSTEAILVKNKKPTVDGGDAFMYSSSCNSKDKKPVVEYRLSDESLEVINDVINRDDNPNSGRAKIRIVGLFEVAKTSGFGHLDAYQYKLTIIELQRASSVSKSLAYPKK